MLNVRNLFNKSFSNVFYIIHVKLSFFELISNIILQMFLFIDSELFGGGLFTSVTLKFMLMWHWERLLVEKVGVDVLLVRGWNDQVEASSGLIGISDSDEAFWDGV